MADGVTREDVIQALTEAGWGDMIHPNYNANSLAARVRELGVAPVEPLKAGSLFRSEAVGCPVPGDRPFGWP
jgi:hypothetical protein